MSKEALQQLVGTAHVDEHFENGLFNRPGCTLLVSGFRSRLDEKERGAVLDASQIARFYPEEQRLTEFAKLLADKFDLTLP